MKKEDQKNQQRSAQSREKSLIRASKGRCKARKKVIRMTVKTGTEWRLWRKKKRKQHPQAVQKKRNSSNHKLPKKVGAGAKLARPKGLNSGPPRKKNIKLHRKKFRLRVAAFL